MHSFFNVSPITELLNSIVRSIIFKLSRLASKSVEPFKTCEFSKKNHLKLYLFITLVKIKKI